MNEQDLLENEPSYDEAPIKIKVCIRVRPLLPPRERKEQVVWDIFDKQI